MRIHLVTDQFNLGGGIEHIYQIAKGLKEFQFRIIGKTDDSRALYKFKNLDNVELNHKGFSPSNLLDGKPNIIHFHHLKPLYSFYKNPFSFKECIVPTIFTAHGLHIHKYEFIRSLRSRFERILRFQLEKRLFNKVDRLITVSMEDKIFIENNYGVRNIVYLTNGINFSSIMNSRSELSIKILRKQLGLPENAFIFVTIARFNFQKGYDILIKAIANAKKYLNSSGILEDKNMDYRFVFVGDGEEMEKMKTLAEKLSVSIDIEFFGARTDVYDILKAADVFILPSRWEGLPIVALETGLLKLPIAASNTYGNREILKENCGILFNNLDPEGLGYVIKDILYGKYDLKFFAENLYNEIHSNYNLDKMLRGLKELYLQFSKVNAN